MEQADHGDLAALLPEDVLADVLRRVAAPRWLAVSRCVCKAWRAIIDDGENLLCTDLPFSGFFITFAELCLPEFFSRPPSPGRPTISGKLDFLPTAIKVRPCGRSLDGTYYILDHCNGLLLLYGGYVVNPATRCWNALPLCPHNHTGDEGIFCGILLHHYYLAFDPRVSSHYQVFQIPYLRWGKDEIDPSEETSEWPPSPYILHVFSSRRGHWEERLFVREGDAAGTLAKARVSSDKLHSVYWRGSLYVHCQSNFIMRISLSEDKYSVIKPPMGVGKINYIGLSEKGVYCASFIKNHIRICILNESSDQLEWILKHDYDLEPVQDFDGQVHAYGPWILQDINYGIFHSHLPYINKEEASQDKFEWNSDDDDFHENLDTAEVQHRPYFEVEILGFHPYKEIMFLSRSETYKLNAMAFAYHLNSFKVESLGSIYPTGHNYFDSGLPNEDREIVSFPYTPCCWIEEIPGSDLM